MKKQFRCLIALTIFLGMIAATQGFGQVAGDYRSSGSGNWNAAGTWETYNGSAWNAAGTPPAGTSGTITIQSGHTVTITTGNPDTIKGAAIVLNGYLKDQAYMNFSSGSMTCNNGSTYELAHPSNSGQGIPTATWNTGSTCLLTGITTSTTGINAVQLFYNLTINCPSWTGNLNLGWNSGKTTIAGNVTVLNTGSGRWQLCAPAASTADTVVINGNLTVDGSASSASALVGVTSNGSGNGGTSILITIGGNVTVTGNPANTTWTNFAVSRGSQGATGTTTWNLLGNSFSMSNATTQNSNTTPGGAKFLFAKSGSQTLTLSSVTFSGGFPVEVASGTTLSMGTSVIAGSGTFTLNSGATLETGHPNGLDSTVANTGTKTIGSGANFTFNGSSPQITGASFPSTVNNLTINNNAGVTLSKTDTVIGFLTLTNGVLKIGTKNIVVGLVSGGSISSYVVTDSSGTLTVNAVGSTQTIFPIGTSGAYSPVWVTNSGTIDTLTVSVAKDTLGGTKNGGGRVKQKWSIAEKTSGGSNATLQFGWVGLWEDPIFASDRAGNAKIFRLSDTTQTGTGSTTAQIATEPYTISRAGITTFGTFAVGNFTGFLGGDGDYRSHQSGPWSDANTWERNNGATWVYPAPVAPSASDSAIAIQSGHVVNVSDSVFADQITVSAGGTLKIDSSKTFALSNGTGTDLTVLGTLANSGTLNMSSGGTLTVGNGGTYEHAQNGGVIPQATWSTGSLFKVTGTIAATSFTSGGGQNFYNVEWNCPNQTGNTSMGLNGATVSGNFKVVATNTGRVHFFGSSSSTVTINGDMIVQGGNFAVQGTSSISIDTVKHFGNISVTGGNFSISRGSQGGSGITLWYMNSGNVSLANATTQNSTTTTSGGYAKFIFAKAGSQTLTLSSMVYGGGGLPIEVGGGTTLSMGTSMLGGAGTFTLNAGATLESGHVNGLDSALATTGTKTLSKAANYTFNGLLAQVTGSVLPDTVNNLTIKDTLGVRLSSGVTVNGALTFTAGKLSIGSKNLFATSIVGTSTTNYIVTDSAGTLKRYPVGATQTLFPVGTTALYSPVWITNAGTVDTFTVAVAPDALGGTLSGNGRVKLKWNINEKTAGGSNATLQFGWNASQEDANFAANRAGNALIVHLPDTLHVGTGAYTSQFTTLPYTLSRGGITTFGSFAVGRLGSITAVGNTAPVAPKEFSLEQNYPNPFNPSTVIYYQLPKESRVSLKIYSLLGQEVATLVDEVKQAGSYTVTFSAQSGFATGVYFYRIQAGDFVALKKMMLIK